MYALVEYSGKQFMLREGEEIKIPYLDQKVGSKISFDNVLLFNDGKSDKIGNPYVKSLNCQGKILSHGKDKKVIVFKKKRRKGYRVKNGHRQFLTEIQISDIIPSGTKNLQKTKTSKPKKKIDPNKANKEKSKLDFSSMNIKELKNLAKEKGIDGISKMKKADLILALS